MMMALLLYTMWSYRQAKLIQVPITELEAEAIQAKKKHKDIIVDVQALLPAKAEEVVIPLDDLDELVKVADAILKPVLHRAEVAKHTYYVIDGAVRYQYVSDLLTLGQKKTLGQRLERIEEMIIEEAKRRRTGKEDLNR